MTYEFSVNRKSILAAYLFLFLYVFHFSFKDIIRVLQNVRRCFFKEKVLYFCVNKKTYSYV